MYSVWNLDNDNAGTLNARREPGDHRQEIRELRETVLRQQIVLQGLWEIIRDRTSLTDKDLESKIEEVDLRDGKADGQISETALRCPECNRVSSSRHWRCLYCGTEFERPVTR